LDTNQVGVGFFLVTVIITVWGLVNVIRRPASAFDDAGKSKGLWLLLMLIGIFVCNIGFFVAVWYLIMVDPQVKRMSRYPPRPGFPGGR
jgi:hypothetical protein